MIHNLRPYPAYKDSGLPWLGKVPEHWEVNRGKCLFLHRKQINTDRSNSNILSLTLRGVVNNDPTTQRAWYLKIMPAISFLEKEILSSSLLTWRTFGQVRVGLVHEDGIMSPAYVRLVPQVENNTYFFFRNISIFINVVSIIN